MLKKLISLILAFLLVSITGVLVFLQFYFSPKLSGTVYLDRAKREDASQNIFSTEVFREKDTGITHIFATTSEQGAHAMGYVHAQERLWQMERQRRLCRGTLSEIMGAKAIGIDTFSRKMNFFKISLEAVKNSTPHALRVLDAYSNGVNDYLDSIGQTADTSGAKFPFEFYALGITKMDQWEPADSICQLKVMNFHLSWNWQYELLKEYIETEAKYSDPRTLAEEIVPQTSDFSHNLVSIYDKNDALKMGKYSNTSILDDYRISQGQKVDRIYDTDPPKGVTGGRKIENISGDVKLEDLDRSTKRRRVPGTIPGVSDKKESDDGKVKRREKKEQAKETQEQEKIQQEEVPQQNNEKVEKKEKEQQQESVEKNQEKVEKKIEEVEKQQAEKDQKAEKVEKKDEKTKEQKTEKVEKKDEKTKEQKNEKVEKKDQKAKEQKNDKAEKKSEGVDKKKKSQKKDKDLEGLNQFEDSAASNAFVIGGKYTLSQKPMLASDPHLGASIPSVWYLVGLHKLNGDYIIGPSLPGVPFITMGKTKHLAYGITAHLTDMADLFKEQINQEGTKYKVDGQWRDLIIQNEIIKVKDGKNVEIKVLRTHRGPLLHADDSESASVLFGGALPKLNDDTYYSLQWSGAEPYEPEFDFQNDIYEIKSADEFFAKADSAGVWYGIPAQIVLAFQNNDIATMTLATAPKRKNPHPYKGCRMADGTTTANDWEGYREVKELPRIKNPQKGFIVSANNRLMPDFVNDDFGTTLLSTARAQRITELIQTQISLGKPFQVQDFLSIQGDVLDIVAREMIPLALQIADRNKKFLSGEDLEKFEKILDTPVQRWHGLMAKNSIGATIYSVWQALFYKSLFHKQFKEEDARITITGGYPFVDFYQRMLIALHKDDKDKHFNEFCLGAYPSYKGDVPCAYNIAKAFVDTYDFLIAELSPRVSDWEYQNIHTNEYPAVPWSFTSLKPFFHRSVPIGGNMNTPAVSKYSTRNFYESKRLLSTHTSTFRQLTDISLDLTQFSIETGQSGNPFSGHYFDMNKKHLSVNELGKSGSIRHGAVTIEDNLFLYRALTQREDIIAKSHEKLVLKHKSEKGKISEPQRTDERKGRKDEY